MKEKRVQSKGWLLMWRSKNVTKELAYKRLLTMSEKIGDITYAIIAKNYEHQCFLRAFIQYKKKVEWKAHKWDLGKNNGVYEPARSWRIIKQFLGIDNWIAYNFCVSEALKKRKAIK